MRDPTPRFDWERRIALFVSPIELTTLGIHVHIDHLSRENSFGGTLASELPHF